jgi:hypothetical protein
VFGGVGGDAQVERVGGDALVNVGRVIAVELDWAPLPRGSGFRMRQMLAGRSCVFQAGDGDILPGHVDGDGRSEVEFALYSVQIRVQIRRLRWQNIVNPC